MSFIRTECDADDWAITSAIAGFGGGKLVTYPDFQPGSHDGCDISYGHGLSVHCTNIAETDMSVHDCTNDYCYSDEEGYSLPFDLEDCDE